MPKVNFNIETAEGDKKFPKKGKNTVTMKKMVIADPGFGLVIKFYADGVEEDSNDCSNDHHIYKITVNFSLTRVDNRESKHEDPVIPANSISFDPPKELLEWTIDGKDTKLGLCREYKLVAPIENPQDDNSEKGALSGRTIKVGYKIRVRYFDSGGGALYDESLEGEVNWYGKQDELSPNHIFHKEPIGAKTDPAPGSSDKLTEAIFMKTNLGVACKISHNIPTDGLEICLYNEDDQYTKLTLHDTGPHEKFDKILYMPYPRVSGNNPEPANFKLKVKAGSETDTFIPDTENNFPFDGDVTLSLEPQPFENDETSS